jgi:hypothetical protein
MTCIAGKYQIVERGILCIHMTRFDITSMYFVLYVGPLGYAQAEISL